MSKQVLPLLFLFMCNANKALPQVLGHYFNPFAEPAVYLPVAPQYKVNLHEPQVKFFGGATSTKFETVHVTETVRPVCILADGKVPSCDHTDSNYPTRPKSWLFGEHPDENVDFSSYLIDPSEPKRKIEITEIPFSGVFLLSGTTLDLTDETEQQNTPPLDFIPVTEDVQERQMRLTVKMPARPLHYQPEVTVGITEVQKVIDHRVTVTLAVKNCMPSSPQIKPCEQHGRPLYLD